MGEGGPACQAAPDKKGNVIHALVAHTAGHAISGSQARPYRSGAGLAESFTRWINYPAWQVDLLQDYPVTEVTLYNRTDCCSERLSNFNVYVLDANQGLVEKKTFSGTVGNRVTINFSGKDARFVRIQLNRNDNLSLAEVVVKANAAYHRTVTQSSTAYGGNPERAVDGNTSGNWGDGSVTHTDSIANVNSWWMVDLGKTRNIGEVVLWNRTDCCSERLSNFTVEVLDANQNRVQSPISLGSVSTRTVLQLGDVAGRYVRVKLNRADFLSLAEVQVFEASGNPQ